MNEKELLTLAAKAAGLTNHKWVPIWNCMAEGDDISFDKDTIWNPLEDNEDAFALAVTLRIDLGFGAQDVAALAWPEQGHIGMFLAHYNGDPLAATRRAITQAAAEIGKAIP